VSDKHEAQFDNHVVQYIAELESGLRQAKKLKCDIGIRANEFGGPFAGMYNIYRLCDIPEYIEWIKEKHGI
jgi:hypothetical protein